MIVRRLRRFVICGLLVVVFLGLATGTAVADHLAVDVSAPETASLGEELEIRTVVRFVESGEPAEGVEIVFYSDASFAGVGGEIELGRVATDASGVAIFHLQLAASGTHAIRIEAIAGPEIQPESVSIPVTVGGQLVRSEAGVDIPGFGAWMVTAVMILVWSIMLVAVVRIVILARSGPSPRRFGVAEGILVVATTVAVGLVVLLIRSPQTHANLDPEGYQRTAVAYTEADYLYPGPGLIAGVTPEQTVAYGRAVFMSRGCAGCHGTNAQGAATAGSPAFASREWMGQVVRTGLPGGMPSYSEIDLSEEDLDAIFVFLFAAQATIDIDAAVPSRPTTTGTTTTSTTTGDTGSTATTESAIRTYEADVAPIFAARCSGCHGSFGGWDASSLDSVLSTGEHAPVVVPGNPDASLLVQRIRGIQTEGLPMPPSGLMSDDEIQVIIDWITAGTP